jgi:hypothetical protein
MSTEMLSLRKSEIGLVLVRIAKKSATWPDGTEKKVGQPVSRIGIVNL